MVVRKFWHISLRKVIPVCWNVFETDLQVSWKWLLLWISLVLSVLVISETSSLNSSSLWSNTSGKGSLCKPPHRYTYRVCISYVIRIPRVPVWDARLGFFCLNVNVSLQRIVMGISKFCALIALEVPHSCSTDGKSFSSVFFTIFCGVCRVV